MIGQRIYNFVSASNKTQKQVANELGMTVTNLAHIFRREHLNTSLLFKIIEVLPELELDICDFFEDTNSDVIQSGTVYSGNLITHSKKELANEVERLHEEIKLKDKLIKLQDFTLSKLMDKDD